MFVLLLVMVAGVGDVHPHRTAVHAAEKRNFSSSNSVHLPYKYAFIHFFPERLGADSLGQRLYSIKVSVFYHGELLDPATWVYTTTTTFTVQNFPAE